MLSPPQRSLFVLWVGWGERKRAREERLFPLPIVPRALSIFSIIAILIGIPSAARASVDETATDE